MVEEVCFWRICFTPISTIKSESIFGFSEFLTAVTLLAVLFTITDIRYKFRLSIAPFKLYTTSYFLLAIIGLLTLFTEVWHAKGWWVLAVDNLDYITWQMFLGLLFFTTFLTWMFYAFIKPPIFNKGNAREYLRQIYSFIVKGSDEELKVVADEIARSARVLMKFANQYPLHEKERWGKSKKITHRVYANDILLLLGNRRLCKHIVATSSITAVYFFDEMTRSRKFNISLAQFARNMTNEAILNKGSFLYEEDGDDFYSGLLGHLKPVSKALYGDFKLIDAFATSAVSPFFLDREQSKNFDASQWKAYGQAFLITLEDYLNVYNYKQRSWAIEGVLMEMSHALDDLDKLNGLEVVRDTEEYKKLVTVVAFVKKAIELIDIQFDSPLPKTSFQKNRSYDNIYDFLAHLIFNFCICAARINSPRDTCLIVQNSALWFSFFELSKEGLAWKIVSHKLRRLIYNEVNLLAVSPNYKGASLLGFCLNVMMGHIKPTKANEAGRNAYALAKAVQMWTAKNYLQLRKKCPDVAASVLFGRLSLDLKGKRLVETYTEGLTKEGEKVYLQLYD